MTTRNIENTKVIFYTDPHEFLEDYKEGFDIPLGAVLDTDNLPESYGLACISTNEIVIFKRFNCSFQDLLATVAHELGHLATGGFKKNPPDKARYDKKHEEKAEHYEQFAVKAYKITSALLNAAD